MYLTVKIARSGLVHGLWVGQITSVDSSWTNKVNPLARLPIWIFAFCIRKSELIKAILLLGNSCQKSLRKSWTRPLWTLLTIHSMKRTMTPCLEGFSVMATNSVVCLNTLKTVGVTFLFLMILSVSYMQRQLSAPALLVGTVRAKP